MSALENQGVQIALISGLALSVWSHIVSKAPPQEEQRDLHVVQLTG